MNVISRCLTILILVLFVVFAAANRSAQAQTAAKQTAAKQTAAKQSANDLRLELATKYENINAMTAAFVQEASSEFMAAPERFSGTLLFSGAKYRIQTGSQTIVTDGITLWIHNRNEKQVIINDFGGDEMSFSLMTFLRQLGNEYEATLGLNETHQGVIHHVLNLKPKQELAQFRSVRLSVRQSDTIVTHLEVIDLNDVQMTIDLSEIRINPPITKESFVFIAPPGVELVDLRN